MQSFGNFALSWGLYSLKRCCFTGIRIPIINLGRSDDHLSFIMRINIPIKWCIPMKRCLLSEQRPWGETSCQIITILLALVSVQKCCLDNIGNPVVGTIIPSYDFHDFITYIHKMASLYWNGPLVATFCPVIFAISQPPPEALLCPWQAESIVLPSIFMLVACITIQPAGPCRECCWHLAEICAFCKKNILWLYNIYNMLYIWLYIIYTYVMI